MRFYAILVVSSILAMVLAAPHPNRDRGTSLVERRGNQFSKQGGDTPSSSTPNQAAVTLFPGSESEPLHELNIDVKKIGKESLPRKRKGVLEENLFGFFDYPLQQYKRRTDLILRDFGKDKEGFYKQRNDLRDKRKADWARDAKTDEGYIYVDSGIFHDPRDSKLPNAIAQAKISVSKFNNFKYLHYVIIFAQPDSRESSS
ncbi:hypothetical protein F5878DRAFT_605586 [Lentinula raphanica]|uniref:Uncharacterized protein n=1 Tax=Lentinula raphanica TaxID=153919 RepID=A0AA38PHU3_9AGAR|nr:hypothetical protein F5878DRAFT_605586 [Lentinula raphanica]